MRKQNQASLDAASLDELVEEMTVDANGEDEQLWAFRQAFEDNISVPCEASCLARIGTVRRRNRLQVTQRVGTPFRARGRHRNPPAAGEAEERVPRSRTAGPLGLPEAGTRPRSRGFPRGLWVRLSAYRLGQATSPPCKLSSRCPLAEPPTFVRFCPGGCRRLRRRCRRRFGGSLVIRVIDKLADGRIGVFSGVIETPADDQQAEASQQHSN